VNQTVRLIRDAMPQREKKEATPGVEVPVAAAVPAWSVNAGSERQD
jgi:hypothetical protein